MGKFDEVTRINPLQHVTPCDQVTRKVHPKLSRRIGGHVRVCRRRYEATSGAVAHGAPAPVVGGPPVAPAYSESPASAPAGTLVLQHLLLPASDSATLPSHPFGKFPTRWLHTS